MSTSADNTEPLDYSYDSPGDSSKPEFSLAADQDHKRETRGRQPRGMLVAAVVVLLFVGAAGLVASWFIMQGNEQNGLQLELSATRADVVLLEERVADLMMLGERLAELEQRIEQLSEALSDQADRVDVRISGVQRELERVNAQGARSEVRIESLHEQLGSAVLELEGAVNEAREEAAQAREQARARSQQTQAQVARASSPPSRPQPQPQPPFRVSGVEWRGGKPFLSIATGAVRSLRDVRLIGERESVDGWQLIAIRGGTAQFSVRGESVDVPIP